MKPVRAVFLVPFTEGSVVGLCDAIESIRRFADDTYFIVCINDCEPGYESKRLKEVFEADDTMEFKAAYEMDRKRNRYGSLWCNLFQAMEFLVWNIEFDYLMKMDTDALVTGDRPIGSIEDYFNSCQADIGLIGSYRFRADGTRRTRWRWALYLLYLVYISRKIPKRSVLWADCLPEARKNGYRLGESVLGGIYAFSRACIERMVTEFPYRRIGKDRLYRARVGEDVLFGLLTFASGFRIGDFGRVDQPMAVAQNYLPIAKEDVIRGMKQFVHSVNRGKDGENEETIRSFFRGLRG